MDLKNKVIEFWKRYFSSETPLENRITYILVLIAFIASTYGFITTITLNLANVSVIISSVNLAISILLLLFISKSKNLYASLVLVCIYFGNIIKVFINIYFFFFFQNFYSFIYFFILFNIFY